MFIKTTVLNTIEGMRIRQQTQPWIHAWQQYLRELFIILCSVYYHYIYCL